jgi:subtilisin family serine protease
MKKYHWVSMIMLLVFSLILSGPGAASNAAPVGSVSPADTSTPSVFPRGIDAGPTALYVPGKVIIQLRSDITVDTDKVVTSSEQFNAWLTENRVFAIQPLFVYPEAPQSVRQFSSYVVIQVPGDGDIQALAAELMRNPAVQLAAPDYLLHLDRSPNDPYFANQWALNDSAAAKLHVPAAWDITTGSTDVVVAVLDTGLDQTHPDLQGKDTGAGYNFINNSTNVMDDQGHGTSVAGIIAAESNNGAEVAGMSWGARVLPVKVCDSTGSCPSSASINGIRWAADHGARIINMSLSGPSDAALQALWQDVADYAYGKGVVLVASAGNNWEYLDTSDLIFAQRQGISIP